MPSALFLLLISLSVALCLPVANPDYDINGPSDSALSTLELLERSISPSEQGGAAFRGKYIPQEKMPEFEMLMSSTCEYVSEHLFPACLRQLLFASNTR